MKQPPISEYRISLTIDVACWDRFQASRVLSDIEEAIGKLDGGAIVGLHSVDTQYSEIECLTADEASEGDEIALHCWCGAIATSASPSNVGHSTHTPTCIEHATDGWVPLDTDDTDELLGLS